MTPLVILDCCSIINFAVIGRVPLLLEILEERGRWTEAVENETQRRSSNLPMGSFDTVQAGLGAAYQFDAITDIVRIEDIRRALGGTSRNPLEHYGEAETIYAITTLPELKGAAVLTDDSSAAAYARHQGIRVTSTPRLLADAFKRDLLQCPEPYDILVTMQAQGRWVKAPASHQLICPPVMQATQQGGRFQKRGTARPACGDYRCLPVSQRRAPGSRRSRFTFERSPLLNSPNALAARAGAPFARHLGWLARERIAVLSRRNCRE